MFVTTQEFNKLTAEKLKKIQEADLVSKTDYYNKLISFNKKIPQIKQNT